MIKIEEKIAKNLPGETSLFISFDYDNLLVDFFKSLPNKKFDYSTKQWEVPVNKLALICNCINQPIEIIPYKTEEKELLEIPNDYKFKTQAYPYQLEDITKLLNEPSIILGHLMGFGKTMMSINTACILHKLGKIKKCLVVCCINSLKWNWLKEIEKHSYERGHILGSRVNRKGKLVIDSVEDRIEDLLKPHDELFLITNIETLRNEKFIEALKQTDIDMMLVDEIHRCKVSSSSHIKKSKDPNKKGKRTSLSQIAENLMLLDYIPRKIGISGTLLTNMPLDAFVTLKWLGVNKSTLTAFKQYFCILGGKSGYEIIGYKNLNVLQNMIMAHMIRRTDNNFLGIPEKTSITEYVELYDEQQKLYDQIENNVLEDADLLDKINPLAKLIRLRQATGCPELISSSVTQSAKLDRMEQLVEEIVAQGDKVLIYSNWEEVTEIIKTRLNKYNPAYVAGDKLKDEDVMQEIDKFQENPNCKCIIGTIGKLGTGWTLTAASYVIFVDDAWTRALKDQAEDRAHRIGTIKNVKIITLVAKNTIDEAIEYIVNRKGAMSDMIIDNITPAEEYKQIIEYLTTQ